ncbi:hypothetical protein MMC14_001967 [Varicellaria rhodocarpa]|nr:hypothetical protein [Varicellaria rhodocarpa]
MAAEVPQIARQPSRQDSDSSTSSKSSTTSTSSTRSRHIVYNPKTFKLNTLSQEDFEKTPGLIRTDSPGKSLDACLYMNVGSEKKPVRSRYATVDVGKLGWVISMQRWMGMHQEIYVRA